VNSSVSETAAQAELPPGAWDLCMVVVSEPGELIAGTDYYSGVGGRTRYGPAWVIGGRAKSEPVALYDTRAEAKELYELLAGQEGKLWAKKEARLRRIAELEAEEAGGGSSRPEPSSGKRSGMSRGAA